MHVGVQILEGLERQAKSSHFYLTGKSARVERSRAFKLDRPECEYKDDHLVVTSGRLLKLPGLWFSH